MSEAPPLSGKERQRRALAERLAAGRITQAEYDRQLARLGRGGKRADIRHNQKGDAKFARKLLADGAPLRPGSYVERAAVALGLQDWSPSLPSAAPLKHGADGSPTPSQPHSAPLDPSSGAAPLPPRALSPAKLAALAKARAARKHLPAPRTVPVGYRSLAHFLDAVREKVGQRYGARTELLRYLDVHHKTWAEWMRGETMPNQSNLDAMALWMKRP